MTISTHRFIPSNHKRWHFIVFLLSFLRPRICENNFDVTTNTSLSAYGPVEGVMESVEDLVMKVHTHYDVQYQGYRSNHIAHALYSLAVLGASKSRIQIFYDAYVQRLEPLKKPSFSLDSSNWKRNIGIKILYSEFLEYFEREISLKGLKGTFDEYIEQLLGESLGGALHPLIFIGFAMEFSNSYLIYSSKN